MQRLSLVWSVYGKADLILGISGNKSKRGSNLRRILLTIHSLNLHFTHASFTWSLFLARGDPLQQVQLGTHWMCVLPVTIFYWLFLKDSDLYADCLKWCEDLHSKPQDNSKIRSCFEKCASDSNKIFEYFGYYLPPIVLCSSLAQIVLQSGIDGRFESVVPIYLPFVSEENTIGRIVSCINVCVALFSLLTFFIMAFGSIFVTIRHAIAIMESTKIRFQSAILTNMASVKDIVLPYCDMIHRLDLLIKLTRSSILCYETCVYNALLLTWIIVTFKPSLVLFAISACGMMVFYFLLNIINEELVDAFEELRNFLYDLEWYSYNPQERRVLLQFMVMVNRPKLLTTGPFHTVCYNNFGAIFQRIYSFCVLINKLVR